MKSLNDERGFAVTMGSSISSRTQAGTLATGKTGRRDNGKTSTNNNNNGKDTKSFVRTNAVAPIIIKNCREEFQHIADFRDPIVMGRIADAMPEHPLVKGKFFLVKDITDETDRLKTMAKHSAPNLRKAKGNLTVYGLGQPTVQGLDSLVTTLLNKFNSVMLLSLREEPVLYVTNSTATVSYSVREQDNLKECAVYGISSTEAAEVECQIRKEILDLAKIKDENSFYFYDSLDKLQMEPHYLTTQYEDYLQISHEVFSRQAFSHPNVRYQRICFPLYGAPAEADIDQLVSFFKEFTCNEDQFSPPVAVFTCQDGIQRTTVGMVMGSLILSHKFGFPHEANEPPFPIYSKNPNYERGEYVVIQQLVSLLPDGLMVKHQVDVVIDMCSEVCNVRMEILDAKQALEDISVDYIVEGESARKYFRKKCKDYLERYFYLICFNAYLAEQVPTFFAVSFSKWMQSHPELYRLQNHLDISSRKAPLDLIGKGERILVADDYVGLDVLGSQVDMKVSNFRKVEGLPLYGMGQPTRAGLLRVIHHLQKKKQPHSLIIMINLRNDLTVECDAKTYSVRDSVYLEEPITFSGISRKELEEKEMLLKREITGKQLQVYHDLYESSVTMEFSNVMTPSDVFEEQNLNQSNTIYHRIPLSADLYAEEKDFDSIVSVLNEVGESVRKEDSPAILFFCRTGKSRTTFAMAAAALILFHKNGFPYGAKPGEQERVSLRNAEYTKGDFIIVHRLIQLLPQGHQVKREVDFVLDRLFESMTTSHFHLREVIFVTYNKMKNAKTEKIKEQLRRESLLLLERYIYLILFNAYVHLEKSSHWRRPFSQWMKEVAAKAGVYHILNSLAFYDFDQSPCSLKTLRNRWRDKSPDYPFSGPFL